MKNFLFILSFLVSNLFALSNNELLKPKSEIYDFTFSSSTGSSDDYENNNSIDKIEWEVEKIVGLLPRNNVVSSCNKDNFNTDICPIGIIECSCDDGYTQKSDGSCEKWIYAEKVINQVYAVKYSREVTNKYYSNIYYNGRKYDYIVNTDGDVGVRGTGVFSQGSGYMRMRLSLNSTGDRLVANGRTIVLDPPAQQVTIVTTSQGSYQKRYLSKNRSFNGIIDIVWVQKQTKVVVERYCDEENGFFDVGENCLKEDVVCPTGYTDYGNATQCRKKESYIPTGFNGKQCQKVGNKFYSSPFECNQNNNCGYGYCEDGQESTSAAHIMPYAMHPIEALVRSGDACNPVPCTEEYEYNDGTATKKEVKNCFGGTTYNESTKKCEKQGSCPSGKSLVNGQCEGWVYANKINVSSTITKNVSGLSMSRNRVDRGYGLYYGGHGGYPREIIPSLELNGYTIQNINVLMSAYTDYGFNLFYSINNGTWIHLAGVAHGPPGKGNVYLNKHFEFNARATDNIKFSYSSGGYWENYISSGSINLIINYLKSSCPTSYTDYGNATQCRKKEYATPTCGEGETLLSNGTCQKELDEDYSYYTYECPTDKNIKGDSWELTVDNTPPGCKDDTFGNCLSIERQTGVCKRQKLTCPSGYGTCTENSDGNYQCNRSGCEKGKAPCFGKICDYTLNDKVTYCENKSCPNTEGVYTDDEGNCKKLACPDNTYEFNNTCIEKD